MKITGPGQIHSKSVKKSQKSKGGGSASFTKELDSTESSESQSAMGVGATAPLANIDALLALQEAPTSTDGRSKGLVRANAMLESLEDIRKGLLLGRIPLGQLQALSAAARQGKSAVNDPSLELILSEIEVRAEVELAKLGM